MTKFYPMIVFMLLRSVSSSSSCENDKYIFTTGIEIKNRLKRIPGMLSKCDDANICSLLQQRKMHLQERNTTLIDSLRTDTTIDTEMNIAECDQPIIPSVLSYYCEDSLQQFVNPTTTMESRLDYYRKIIRGNCNVSLCSLLQQRKENLEKIKQSRFSFLYGPDKTIDAELRFASCS